MHCLNCGERFDYDQENISYQGRVRDADALDEISRQAEDARLRDGCILYYYFEEITLQYISGGRIPTARARKLCQGCLKATWETDTPHYGDGVYLTFHPQLFAFQTHAGVLASHGISSRPYRAIYLCNEPGHFRKVLRSGGVTRSRVHNETAEDRLEILPGVLWQMSDGVF